MTGNGDQPRSDGSGVVGNAEHQAANPVARLDDVGGPQQPLCGFDGGLESHSRRPFRPPHFDAVEHAVGKEHVAGVVHLREDQGIDAMAGSFRDLEQVPIGKRRVQRVDADRHRFLPPVEAQQGVNDLRAGGLLRFQGDAVLEVEHDHIGVAVLGLGVHFLQMAGNGEVGSSWLHECSLSL